MLDRPPLQGVPDRPGTPGLPAYALRPGEAFAERAVWESRFRREMERELVAHVESLTAAGFPGFPGLPLPRLRFPGWPEAVSRLAGAVVGFPLSAVSGLLSREPQEADPVVVADRLARTVATSAYNEHVLRLMASSGVRYKRWVTRRDAAVRPSHVLVDGESVPLSSPFVVGGSPLHYPGDSSTAPVGEWWNCRCVVIGDLG